MELQYKHLSKRKKSFFEHIQDNKEEIQTKFAETRVLAHDYIERKTTDKAHKKAFKDYNKEHNELMYSYQSQTSTAKRLLRNIKRQNELISQLFEKETKKHVSVFGTFVKDSLVYFPYSKTSDVRNFGGSKTKKHFNIGREKLVDNWYDLNLSPIGKYSYSTAKPFYPIYRIISIKKSEVELKQLYTKKIIRLIKSREYYAFNLHLRNTTPQATLNSAMILTLLVAIILNSQIKPKISNQITLNSFL